MSAALYEQPVIPGLEPFCPSAPASVNQGLALDKARAEAMEALYQSSGRSNPEHPRHGTFTGLWEDICLTAGRALMNHALQHPEQLRITARPAQPPMQVDPRPDGLSLEEALAIREQAHAAAAESIRLQRGADLLRAQYFRGLAALHDGPGLSPFEELGTPAWRS
jgi:hypothetical protein